MFLMHNQPSVLSQEVSLIFGFPDKGLRKQKGEKVEGAIPN